MQIVLLTLAAFFILSFRNGSLVESRGMKKKSDSDLHSDSPYFCAKKYDECINHEVRGPYKASKTGCEHKLYRKYYCTSKMLHKPLTNAEQKKYHIQSRTVVEDGGRNERSDGMPPQSSSEFPESLEELPASASVSASEEETTQGTSRGKSSNDTRDAG